MRIKTLIAILLTVTLMVCFSACSPSYEYDPDWIIGKTSKEVVERYGQFDNTTMLPHEDGLYYSSICSYIIVEARVRFLGTTPPQLFSIGFNSKGIAHRCFEETGGKGG